MLKTFLHLLKLKIDPCIINTPNITVENVLNDKENEWRLIIFH